MYPNVHSALKQYSQVNLHGNAAYANPHRLVQMLMEGAMERLLAAKGMIERGQIADKAQQISRAMEIIDGLRLCLDKQAGGEIARNLDDLYDYMSRRLLEANLKNSGPQLDEVHALLGEISSAWATIGSNPEAQKPISVSHGNAHDVPVVG